MAGVVRRDGADERAQAGEVVAAALGLQPAPTACRGRRRARRGAARPRARRAPARSAGLGLDEQRRAVRAQRAVARRPRRAGASTSRKSALTSAQQPVRPRGQHRPSSLRSRDISRARRDRGCRSRRRAASVSCSRGQAVGVEREQREDLARGGAPSSSGVSARSARSGRGGRAGRSRSAVRAAAAGAAPGDAPQQMPTVLERLGQRRRARRRASRARPAAGSSTGPSTQPAGCASSTRPSGHDQRARCRGRSCAIR